MPKHKLTPIAAAVATSLGQVVRNNTRFGFGILLGMSVMLAGYAMSDSGLGNTLASTSSTLLSQEESKIADNIKQDAEDCAKGTKEGTIGHAIKQAMLIHETFAAAPVNVESLFDANSNCFSGVSQIFDLSFAIPSLSSIISAASSAVLQYAQKQVCTAVNQVSSLVTTPINQAISAVNGMTSFGDLNGLANGLVQQGMSQIDPNIGAQYYTGTTGGTYTVNVNPFNATQTSFDTGTTGASGSSGTTGATGTTGNLTSSIDQINTINQQIGNYQAQVGPAQNALSQAQQQLASCQAQGLNCASYQQQVISTQTTLNNLSTAISKLQSSLGSTSGTTTSTVAARAASPTSNAATTSTGFVEAIGSLFN